MIPDAGRNNYLSIKTTHLVTSMCSKEVIHGEEKTDVSLIFWNVLTHGSRETIFLTRSDSVAPKKFKT